MTKAEYIERYGIEWYEEYKKQTNIKNKVRIKDKYHNDSEFRERCKANSREYSKNRYKNDPEYRERCKEDQKERLKFDPEFREYHRLYRHNDLNSNGQTKHYIRTQSNRILFEQRKHTRFKDYEIHHCFGYDDPSKFIYIPKSLHGKIHQYLRDNNIDANSNHYDYIKHMINECEEYTYISI